MASAILTLVLFIPSDTAAQAIVDQYYALSDAVDEADARRLAAEPDSEAATIATDLAIVRRREFIAFVEVSLANGSLNDDEAAVFRQSRQALMIDLVRLESGRGGCDVAQGWFDALPTIDEDITTDAIWWIESCRAMRGADAAVRVEPPEPSRRGARVVGGSMLGLGVAAGAAGLAYDASWARQREAFEAECKALSCAGRSEQLRDKRRLERILIFGGLGTGATGAVLTIAGLSGAGRRSVDVVAAPRGGSVRVGW